MTPAQFVRTLQIADSLFPVGAFAYSDGLESATASRIHDADSLRPWLRHFVDAVFVPCEGLALLKCMRAIHSADWLLVQSLDRELTALKPAAEMRAGSKSVGRRLLATYRSISGDAPLFSAVRNLPECNAPIAYGIVFAHRGIDSQTAFLAFGYTRLAGMVSAGMRLMALGQQQGQSLLSHALEHLCAAAGHIDKLESEPLRSFSPLVDIEQMNHRYVYSRLFRS